ncbi:MAG: hypothetical protein LBR16_03665, partial [Treponema sp.]|nr:hypothetical protein [Treponema sp.]
MTSTPRHSAARPLPSFRGPLPSFRGPPAVSPRLDRGIYPQADSALKSRSDEHAPSFRGPPAVIPRRGPPAVIPRF